MSPPAESTNADPGAQTLGWWHDAVRDQERRGELLAAFDIAERALTEHASDIWLKHRAVLALARAGATAEAERRFFEYGLDDVGEEDVAALRARITKDRALAAEGEQRRLLAAGASGLYEGIFERTGGYYPAINAATLHLLAGEPARSTALAREVLATLERDGESSYYTVATEAEAHLLLREEDRAGDALARAAELHGGDYAALATTRRQLRLVCEHLGVDRALLGVLAGPAVVHYCGHRLDADPSAQFIAEQEDAVVARVAREVSRRRVGFAYGSMASGADVLWAEQLIAAGAELHVVLPFALEEFIRWSVAPAGERWVSRFERCLSTAASVRYATENAFLGDDVLFRYASELAMGLALLRASYLDADARQLAIWDGEPARGAAGTAIDVQTWRSGGHESTVVAPDGTAPAVTDHAMLVDRGRPSAGQGVDDAGERPKRVVRAMLFGDIKGFSKLTDEQMLPFSRSVMGSLAAVLERHSASIGHRNTWGDAIYVVFEGATEAAACALELQRTMSSLNLASEDLPATLAMRLGGHLGPVFKTTDPVLGSVGFIGSHVSRTARIEPVTPPGAVYVTEPFAAALALASGHRFTCDYVGHMPTAKDSGRLRMYRLRGAEATYAG
jgi:hypothetical protein